VSRSRLAVLAVLVALAAAALAGEQTQAAPQSLDDGLAHALQAPGIDPRKTSAVAVDLQTDTTVFTHNAQASLLPASAEKLPVSLAALEVLGPRFRFRTEVVGLGARRGHVWRGSIWLVGYGDPTLAVSDLDRLARLFAATGIRRIAGRVFGDDSRYDARRDVIGWKSSYLGLESRPISALSVAQIPLTGPNGSAIAAARAYVDAASSVYQ
jgi:D-alanyl-D-alanine carboxypeptidase/D-alanyl-D-alanine-endopeptidase (penicillin-binding protein 4)